MFKLFIYSLISLQLYACASSFDRNEWPSDLPQQQIFIDHCQRNNSCTTETKIKQHLIWIKRFYHGSILYPTGWNEMTDIVIATLDSSENDLIVRNRLNKLGLDIVLEWAQDNNVRLINSKMLAIWADALATSTENSQHIEFITQIEQDVDMILAGTLSPAEISNKRYNLVVDYDNF